MSQLDLFVEPTPPLISAKALKEEMRFGKWDAKCGLPLRNYYSSRISGDRLAVYELAFLEERNR